MKKRIARMVTVIATVLLALCLMDMAGVAGMRAQAAKKNGFVTENGKTYYYRNGKKVKGLQLIKKKYYYFDLKTKVMLQNAMKEVDGKAFFFHEEKGYAITGVAKVKIKKKTFYVFFDPSTKKGYAAKGIATDPTTKYIYYVTSPKDGKVLTSTSKSVNKKSYYFDKDGHAVTGVVKLKNSSGAYYCKYYDPSTKSGFAPKGIKKEENGDMYLVGDKGTLKSGFQRDAKTGDLYLIDEKTMKVLTGWQDYKGYRYYFDEETGKAYKAGVHTIDGKRYVFLEKNMIKTGGQTEVDGKAYYCGEDGVVLEKGIVKGVNDKKEVYYKYYDASTKTGFPDLGGKEKVIVDGKYCVGKNGILYLRQQLIDGKWYYFDEEKLEMQTGVYNLGDKYLYYFDPAEKSGLYAGEGIAQKDGKYYYFILDSTKTRSYIFMGLKYVYEADAKQAGLDGIYYFDKETGAAICNGSVTVGKVKFNLGANGKATWEEVGDTKVGKMILFGLSRLGTCTYGELRPDTKEEGEALLPTMSKYTCANFVSACYLAGFKTYDMYEGYNRNGKLTYGLYSDEQAKKCATEGEFFYDPEKLKVGDFAFFNDEECNSDSLKLTGACNRVYNINGRRTHIHHINIYMGKDDEYYYFLETTSSSDTIRIRSMTRDRLDCPESGYNDSLDSESGAGDSYYIVAYGRLGQNRN